MIMYYVHDFLEKPTFAFQFSYVIEGDSMTKTTSRMFLHVCKAPASNENNVS